MHRTRLGKYAVTLWRVCQGQAEVVDLGVYSKRVDAEMAYCAARLGVPLMGE